MNCTHERTIVVDSRRREGQQWRKRRCFDCGVTFHTLEIAIERPPGMNWTDIARAATEWEMTLGAP